MQYVGAGPYKLERWEPGNFIEGSAFDGHILGKPKIDRFISRPVPDENTAMTNLLAGSADIGLDNALRFEHAVELKRQWGDTGGTALMDAGTRHWVFIQFRPELLKTQALMDVRVRRALAYATDREPINQALFEGQGIMAEQWIPPKAPYYEAAERAATKYPYDPRRAEELLTEAGLTKDSSGFFGSGGERFKPGFLIDGSPLFERETNIIQDTWARIGIDMDPKILSAVESRQNSSRTTFPDMYGSSTGIRESSLDIFSTAQIATANRNWAGNNRGGWSNPDFERLWTAYNTTLDRSERNQQVVDMMKVVTDQLPGIMLYFNIRPTAFTSVLKGPELGTPESLFIWNVHEWEMK
jgi:peptide/nickel transport system substrate-binding protein